MHVHGSLNANMPMELRENPNGGDGHASRAHLYHDLSWMIPRWLWYLKWKKLEPGWCME
jgi:hypothetical protein